MSPRKNKRTGDVEVSEEQDGTQKQSQNEEQLPLESQLRTVTIEKTGLSFTGIAVEGKTVVDFVRAVHGWSGITRGGTPWPCTELNKQWFFRTHKDLACEVLHRFQTA